MKHWGRWAAAGAGLAAAAGAVGVRRAAGRAGVSTGAWAMTAALPWLFPGGDEPERLDRRIALDRKRGPAEPPARARVGRTLRRETVGTAEAWRVSPKHGRGDPGAPGGGRPILYLHGGAYLFDLLPAHWPVLTGLADRTGREVVALLYPLAPEHHVEDGLAAAEAAYLALLAGTGGVPVAVAGDSAGGGLALALAHLLRARGHPAPERLMLFFPWLDATGADPAQPDLMWTDPMLRLEPLRRAGRMWAGDLDPADPRVSPLFGDQSCLPPVLVQVGTRDILLADARRFKVRCPAATVTEYPGMFHGWVCAPIPEGRAALAEAATFLKAGA